MDLLDVVLIGIIGGLLCLLFLFVMDARDDRTFGEVIAGVPRRPRKAASPEEPAPTRPKHRTRGSGMFGGRGTYAEADPLYKAIRSGMPLDYVPDEHSVTMEIRRRVNLMVMEPIDKKIADLEQQLRSVRLANRMLKEVASAKEEGAAQVGGRAATNGSGS